MLRSIKTKTIDKIKNVINKLKNKIKTVIEKLKTKIKNIIEKFKTKLKNVLRKIVNTIKKLIKKIIKKLVNVVKKLVKKIIEKITKKFMKHAAKKIAKKAAGTLLKMGLKRVFATLKKWAIKFVVKIVGKILANAALACIPILGWIISAGLLIWDIYCFIRDFAPIVKMLNETPGAWDMIKDIGIEYLEKAMDKLNALCELGKKLFNWLFVELPKMILHALGEVLDFYRNPVAKIAKTNRHARYKREYADLFNRKMAEFNKLSINERWEKLDKGFDDMIGHYRWRIGEMNRATGLINNEESKGWRNNDAILEWMDWR
jgi:hypothetical protein